jgi:hypothetical protein
MKAHAKLTPLGGVLLSLLTLAVVAVAVGSSTLQAIGFVVALILVIVLVADRLPRMRVGGGHDLGLDAPTLRRRGAADHHTPGDELDQR